MITRKSKNNLYALAEDIWVRDFTNPNAPSRDINDLATEADNRLFLQNELVNRKAKYIQVGDEDFFHPNVVIVSDGFDFVSKQKLLAGLDSKNITIIATNGALAKWKLISPNPLQRKINFYVINNPYAESMAFLPKAHRYFPRCIASSRTYPQFLERYRGDKLLYVPTPNERYSGPLQAHEYTVDDYRSPICSAIGLAYRFGVQKLLLFCCDNSFADERPASVMLSNNLYCYPQHIISQKVVDANLFWLKEVKIGDHSSGLKYESASYIPEEGINEFFREEDNV